jgi:carbon monoxide dehydrogenase subunit G
MRAGLESTRCDRSFLQVARRREWKASTMASIHREIRIRARVDAVWDALRDVGALHTRLVPGFVVDTKLDGDARIVTFANGMTIREPIVAIDEQQRRVVWGAEGGQLTHYNGAAQVFPNGDGSTTTLVWTADFLPHDAASFIEGMLEQGAAAMKKAFSPPPR